MKEEKNLTLTDLAVFTEETLLSAVENIVDGKISKYNHDIKGYIDDKLADTTCDLRSEIKNVKTELQTEIKDVKTELQTEIKDVKTELQTEIKDVKTELQTEIKDVKTELHQTKNDIISTIKGEKERDKSFKNKLITIIKENKLAKEEEIELLETLI